MRKFLGILFFCVIPLWAQPAIIKGSAIPSLIGISLNEIRVVNADGDVIPFQIDEMINPYEYICNEGIEPNDSFSDKKLSALDEVVFLDENCSRDSIISSIHKFKKIEKIQIPKKNSTFFAWIVHVDNNFPLPTQTLHYDTRYRQLKTPYYYARFAQDRFHFTEAGVYSDSVKRYIDLTKELKVEIRLHALWGIVPIVYSEDNLVCTVKRYKVGPIRMIRRGDFHLRLGLGIKGNHAVVNQICYAQFVEVPVIVSFPVRLKSIFREAYIEMVPILTQTSKDFTFSIKQSSLNIPLSGASLERFIPQSPVNQMFSVCKGEVGFAWAVETSIPKDHLSRSCFVFRKPSQRKNGFAECGFRLFIGDVPKGRYMITNKIYFNDGKHQTF